MALSQSALLEVLDALNASDSTDVIRKALQVMLQLSATLENEADPTPWFPGVIAISGWMGTLAVR